MLKFFRSNHLSPAVEDFLKDEATKPEERRWLQELPIKVHKNESGYLKDQGTHYLKVGLSAMENITEALKTSGLIEPSSVLDFPCGYARVMRFLRVAFPNAQIEGADLDQKAVRFCSQLLNTNTRISKHNFDELDFNETYDLIWCGSLVTHLDKDRISSLLRFFYRHLNPQGLCVFTSHGLRVEDLLARGEINYSLTPDLVEKVLAEYRATGAGFSEYNESRDGYGISLTSDKIIRDLANKAGQWNCTYFAPAGWDNHQDVYGFLKDA